MIKTIQFKKAIIRYSDQGKEIPVVLLHGYLESLSIWDDFSTSLTKYCRVIRIDLPGHGESGIIGETHTMERMAESVKAVLDYLKIDKVYLIGHSLGGYVTLAFFELFSERLFGFSLFHSHPLADTPETKENRKREIGLVMEGKKKLIYNVNVPRAFADENLEIFKKQVDFAKEIAGRTEDKGIIALLKGMMKRPDRRNLLAGAALPFLWILGKKDNYIPYQTIINTVEIPGNGELVTLQKSGHMGFMEEKEKALEAVLGFVT
jgi:pimeloyl-ACP methyl ester carboxylesterase